MTAILEVMDAVKTYRNGVAALKSVSISIEPGTTLGLVGESGSGKSTLARSILRLQNVDSGGISFDGVDLLALRGRALHRVQRRLQVVPQNPDSSLNPRLTVAQSIEFPLRVAGWSTRDRAARVSEMLDAVAMPSSSAHRYPHEISGGQSQRVAIARALSTKPRLVICDEAVSALDKTVQAQVLNVLADLQRATGTAYLFISHDLAVVEHMADTVAVMRAGEIVEVGTAERIWSEPQHEYTRQLIDSVPGTRPS